MIEFQKNIYAYANANPISFSDPTGLGPVAAGICELANAAYGVYSFNQTMNELSANTGLIRDQLSRVNKEISECPADNGDRRAGLEAIRNDLVGQLSRAIQDGSPGPLAGMEDIGWGMVGAGACGLLLLAPTP